MNTQIINQAITRVPPHGILSSFLLGSGLSYSVQSKNYSHIPLVLFFPTAYTGYHVFREGYTIYTS
jgi:hypothetical protein